MLSEAVADNRVVAVIVEAVAAARLVVVATGEVRSIDESSDFFCFKGYNCA